MSEPQVQRIAFVAIIDEKNYKIGMCHEGIKGYTPTLFGPYSTYEAYNKMAAELNACLGLSQEMAHVIIASTMRRDPRKHLIGKIELEDDTTDETLQEIMEILDKVDITYEEGYPFLYINYELPEGEDMDDTVFQRIEYLLQTKGMKYEMDIREYQETGKVYSGCTE